MRPRVSRPRAPVRRRTLGASRTVLLAFGPPCASPPSYVRVPVVLRARASGFLLPFPARLHAQLLKPCDFQREVFTRPREPLCNDSGNFK